LPSADLSFSSVFCRWAATTALPGTWHTVAPSGLQKTAVVPVTEEAWCALG
jgi:hypothetical protein